MLEILSSRASLLILIACLELFAVFPPGEAAKGSKYGGLGIDARTSGTGQLGEKGPIRVPKCMGEEMTLEMSNTAISACENETYPFGGETGRLDKNLCFTSCVWKNLGLIKNDLTFTDDISTFVIGTFPSPAQPKVMAAIEKCAKNNKWPVSLTNNCSSHRSMRVCLLKSVMKICKSKVKP